MGHCVVYLTMTSECLLLHLFAVAGCGQVLNKDQLSINSAKKHIGCKDIRGKTFIRKCETKPKTNTICIYFK